MALKKKKKAELFESSLNVKTLYYLLLEII